MAAPSAADAVLAYRAALAASEAELVEFGIDALDVTGIPVWTVAAFLPGGRLRNGVGYGADLDAAQASALGECLEVLWATSLPPVRRGPAGPSSVDPRTLILDAGRTWSPDDERLWVRARRLPAGDEVEVPLELVAQSAADLPEGYDPLVTPITNGLGVHTSREAALDHALRELVQRDGNAVAYRALDDGVRIDVDLGELAPGVRPIAKAAVSDLGLANVYVVADDPDPPHPLMLTAAGEGADPDPRTAIAKALRELGASRARKAFSHGPLEPVAAIAPGRYMEHVAGLDLSGEEPAALEGMLGWLALGDQQLRALNGPALAVRRTIGIDELPANAGRTTYDLLVERGFDVLEVDLTPPRAPGGVHLVKALVPGLEVETMSYGRCGPRNLQRLLQRDLGLVGEGPPPAGALALPLPDGHGPAWLDPARVAEVVGPLYPLYREPSRHAAPLTLARRRAGGGGG